MDRSDSGGFLSAAFGDDADETHEDDEFLLIDDDESMDDQAQISNNDSIPTTDLQNTSSFPTSKESLITENEASQASSWRADEEIQMEPVKFDDEQPSNKKKSAMKKSSSYGCLTDEIPICMKNRSYKTLPKPDMNMIRSQSSASFFPPPEEARKIKRNVSFSNISMRNYPLVLGDNPSVSYGPPTTLDWEYSQTNEIGLEAYEKHRAPRRKPREMLLNYYQRKDILSKSGHSEEEMKQAKRQAEKAKRQRNATKSLMPLMKVEDAVQSAARKAKRVVKKSGSTGSLSGHSSSGSLTAACGS